MRTFFEKNHMDYEGQTMDKGAAWVSADIPIKLGKASSFFDSKRSAILVGDAAISSSFIRGLGANTALSSARLARDFFTQKLKCDESAYLNFNENMNKTAEYVFEENKNLFELDYNN